MFLKFSQLNKWLMTSCFLQSARPDFTVSVIPTWKSVLSWEDILQSKNIANLHTVYDLQYLGIHQRREILPDLFVFLNLRY